MCFSAEASFAAAAVLVPAGAITVHGAYRTNGKYLAIAALPLFFGLQQLFEGLVWTGNALSSDSMVERYSMAYMFFSWLAWPVWVPFAPPRSTQLRTATSLISKMMLGPS